MAYNYTAQIIDAPRSNLDKTVRVFDQYNKFDLNIDILLNSKYTNIFYIIIMLYWLIYHINFF